jgi:glycosyltransferase involved in cell wall biosynthesis
VRDLSVIVVTYNRAASLPLTLEALGAQVTPPDLSWEIVVVDNNSTDNTRRAIENYIARAPIPVRYVFAQAQGVSHARNAGIAHSNGDSLAFTDDDVTPAPDWVAMIATVMRETGADMIGGRIRPAWQRPPPRWLEKSRFLDDRLAILEHPTPATIVRHTDMPMIWGANMAIRRKVFDAVGLFDPHLGGVGKKLYRGEETDVVRRGLAAGYRAIYDPRLVVWHRIGEDRMRVAYFTRHSFDTATGEAMNRSPVPARALPGVIVYRTASLAYRLLRWLIAASLRHPDALQRWLACSIGAGYLWGLLRRRFGSAPGR